MSDSLQHHGPQHTRLPCLSLSLGVCSNSRPLSWWLEVDNDQLKGSLKLILLPLHEKLQKNSASTILSSFGIWSKLERWKSSVSWCLISWAHTKKRKKIIILECRLLLFYLCNNNEPFLDQIVTCDEKWILQNWWWPAQQLDGEEASKHFPKPNLHPKTRSWSLFGGLLMVCSITAFWILAKPLYLRTNAQQIDEMPWKPQYLQLALTKWA